jgi:flagellar hook assembly protein FlgD
VLRKLLIAVTAAGLGALPAGAVTSTRGAASEISAQSVLMPGVGYQRQVEFTPRGPVVLDVVTAPRPDGSLYTLAPALSNGAIGGTESLTDMEKDASATATVVGVNGDYFAAKTAVPTGILMRGGALDSAPALQRSSLGISANGTLTLSRVVFDGTWRGTDQRRQLDLNAAPVAGHTTLYTSAWGPATPAENGVVEDVIGSFPPAQPDRVLTGSVTQVVPQGATPIPPGGAVLVARGAQAPHLTAEAPAATTVEVRLTLTPDWSAMASAIGGGPVLVLNGKPVFRANENFGDPVLNTRGARSAVGQLSDGRIVLVTVEGGGSAYSVGMTNYELAVALVRLGAVTAMGLGSGASAAMAFDGSLLTRQSAPAEPVLSDALLLSYNGVYAAPPGADVVSPNGDGVDDAQTFTYKLLRPSTVTASLTGPDKQVRTLVQDAEQPGVHTIEWNAETATATPEVEGAWKFTVTAVDDQGRTTSADRQFAVNDTLGSLAAAPAAVQLRAKAPDALTTSFQLAHPALVTATIETRTGIVIATLLNEKLQPGPQQVLWDGQTWTGALAFTGAYQVHVTAQNSIGTVSLAAPFTAHR